MTHTITLDPETEAALEKRAARQGVSVAEYMTQVAARIVRPRSRGKAKTGAEVLAELQAEGLLTGYGDPSKSSSELAGELRTQFSQREHGG